MHRTLIVTNDFPPRPGGIQAFVHNMAVRQPAGSIVVYASTWRDGSEVARFDAEQPFPVIRDRTKVMVPTPRVTRRAAEILRAEKCDSVWFGAAAPLGLMAPALRRAGAARLLGMTHGHEAAWAQLPAARQLLRRIGAGTDVLTYLGEYTRSRIAGAVGPQAAARMVQLPPGVDETTFHPGSGGAEVRRRLGLADRPVVVCVSRLVPRKGQDTLIEAMPQILADVPDAVLLIVGGGPYRADLEKLADAKGVRASVRFTGSVPWEELPAHYGAGDVFAMPCRTRRGGWTSRGWASSTWRPRRPVCRWSRATPAARRTRCWRARPGTWCRAARPPRPPSGSSGCWATRSCGGGWARPGGAGWSAPGAGTCWPGG